MIDPEPIVRDEEAEVAVRYKHALVPRADSPEVEAAMRTDQQAGLNFLAAAVTGPRAVSKLIVMPGPEECHGSRQGDAEHRNGDSVEAHL
jgi:hypothetical protein